MMTIKIIAYACSTRPNHLWSVAQFNSALPKNRTDCDIPLVSLADYESLRSRAEKAEAELSRRTANPADYRYWEGRYRDEKADNERLEAACEKLAAALERLCDYSNAEYVPNILFELASDALSEYRKEVSE